MYSICRIVNFMTYLPTYIRRDIHSCVLALVSGKVRRANEAGIKIANFISPLNRKFRIS